MKLNKKKGKSLTRLYAWGWGAKRFSYKWMRKQTNRAIRHLPIDFEIPNGSYYKKHWDRANVTDSYSLINEYIKNADIEESLEYFTENGIYAVKINGMWYRNK